MRNCVLSAAAMCFAAVPVFAQSPKEVSGPWTLTPTMVMCTDLPATVKPVASNLVIKDAHTTDVRLASYPGSHVMIGRYPGDNFEIGQRFISSRIYGDPKMFPRPGEGFGDIRVSGVIRVIAINEWHARAVVELACDTVEAGDFLEPFVETALPSSAAAMLKPDFDERGKILFGLDNRVLMGDGDVVSIDRGSAHGVVPGARFAIYRDKYFNGLPLIHIGEAVVMTVNEQSSKVAITKALDGIESGDTVVPRRLQQ
jgi:hypothetical protein